MAPDTRCGHVPPTTASGVNTDHRPRYTDGIRAVGARFLADHAEAWPFDPARDPNTHIFKTDSCYGSPAARHTPLETEKISSCPIFCRVRWARPPSSRTAATKAGTVLTLAPTADRTHRTADLILALTVITAGAAMTITPPVAVAAKRPTVIADGHVDAPSVRLQNGRVHLSIRQNRGSRDILRNPATTVLRVTNRGRTTLPTGMGFIGRRGTRVWAIPQTQQRGVIWAGWSTQGVRPAQVRGGITWQLTRVTGPGRVVLFQTTAFGPRRVLFTSARKMPQRQVLRPGVHQHGSWVFTRPGIYRLTFRVTLTPRAGSPRGATTTVTYRIG